MPRKRKTSLIEDLVDVVSLMRWWAGVAFAVVGYLVLHRVAKQWKAFKVGVDVVRELYGVMAAKGATGGFVVTSGRFTDDASNFAAGRNVRLIDGPKLFALIKQARRSPATSARPQTVSTPQQTAPMKAAVEPSCPKCGASMLKRVARSGSNAGNEFWGCSTFPACRGIRQLG